MIVRAIKLRAPITHFLDLERSRHLREVEEGIAKPFDQLPANSVLRLVLEHRLGSDDWAIIHELAELLEPFKDTTKQLEGRPSEQSATGIADVVPLLKILMEMLEKVKVQYCEASKKSYPKDHPNDPTKTTTDESLRLPGLHRAGMAES
jgi:hypothetical protein